MIDKNDLMISKVLTVLSQKGECRGMADDGGCPDCPLFIRGQSCPAPVAYAKARQYCLEHIPPEDLLELYL